MADIPTAAASIPCPACGTQIAAGLLTCPACNRLTYADDLKQIAAKAETEERANNLHGAIALWRDALERLPEGSKQHQAILNKVDSISRQLEAAPSHSPASSPPSNAKDGHQGKHGNKTGLWAVVVTVALLLTKFKFVLVFILAKAKFLLLGLSKMGTLWTMLLSFGVYWAAWGWKFAAGLVLSIYVHEMGHVAALRRFGIKATVPMFIPGFGALVRLKQLPSSPREDARIGLAGPWWGMGAAFAAFAVWAITRHPIWAAIAQTGAWLNLFNLLPVWQLDGGRGFNALSRWQAWVATAIVALTFLWTHDGLLMIIALFAGYRAFTTPAKRGGDNQALFEYGTLTIILAAMSFLLAPMTGHRP